MHFTLIIDEDKRVGCCKKIAAVVAVWCLKNVTCNEGNFKPGQSGYARTSNFSGVY